MSAVCQHFSTKQGKRGTICKFSYKIKKAVNPLLMWIYSLLFCGDKEDRTPDLLNAIQALYQLSYIPKELIEN